MEEKNNYLTPVKHLGDNGSEMRQAVSYLRYSDPGQGEGYTIENQREYCHKAAERLGYTITKEFKDEGISGGDSAFPKRKGLLNLLSFCRDKGSHISAVILYKIDRLSRSNFIYANVKKELADQGIRIISATEETPNSPTGDTMQGVFALFAEWDNAMRSMRATDGMRKRIENGLPPTAPALGYLPNGKGKPLRDPERFELIKEGWLMIEKGVHTVESIADYLKGKGLKGKGGRLITAKTLYKTFRNPFYAGYIHSSLMEKDYPGIHEPMVSLELFHKVQDIIAGRNPQKQPRQVIREEFPLRGLVLCQCGRPLTGCFCQGKLKKYPYYLCHNKDVKPIPTGKMHEEFIRLLDEITPKKKFVDFYAELLREKWQGRYSLLRYQKTRAKRQLREIEAKQKRLLQMRLDEEIDKEAFLTQKKALEDEKLICESDFDESKLEEIDIDAAVAFLKAFLSNLSKYWLEANVVQKRAMQCLIFEEKLVFTDGAYQTPKLKHEFRLLTSPKSHRVSPTFRGWNTSSPVSSKLTRN